jgi:ATP-dependent DNA helicase RecQ
VIFHDRTLAAIAAARPATPDDLAVIKGVGPAKLAAYGEAILNLCQLSP